MLDLDAEQQMLVESLREIGEREFADRACDWDGKKPWPNLELLAERGYLGISLPEEYGGGGMTEFEALLMLEVLGRICPDTAYALPDLGAARAIDMFGSDALKERYLPPVTAAEDFIAIGISESGAGSDVQSMETRVTEEGDDLVVNGEKTWVSSVPDSSATLVWAKFPDGMGTFVLDMDSPGVEIGQHFTNMMGYTQSQFFMNDVVVPEENVLVRGPNAFKQQLVALNWERLGSAALSNAIALFAFDRALDYAGDRVQFGQPIGDFQGIEWKLADMATRLEQCRALVHQAAADAHDNDRVPDRLLATMANLASATMLEEVASESLQIHGANGYQQGHPIEYIYRMARSRRIAAGTDEIQKNDIAHVVKRDGLPELG